MPKNHYEILELESTATADEINKAYLRLVRQHAPDKTLDSKSDQTTYTDILTAGKTLRDPEKKKKYDQGLAIPPCSTPMLRINNNAASGDSSSTALVAYREISLHSLLNSANATPLELANQCESNLELAQTAWNDEKLRKTIGMWWYIPAEKFATIAMSLARDPIILLALQSNGLLSTPLSLAKRYKVIALGFLTQPHIKLTGIMIAELIQLHSIAVDQLHAHAQDKYKDYRQLLETTNSEMDEKQQLRLVQQIKDDYKICTTIAKKHPQFGYTTWHHPTLKAKIPNMQWTLLAENDQKLAVALCSNTDFLKGIDAWNLGYLTTNPAIITAILADAKNFVASLNLRQLGDLTTILEQKRYDLSLKKLREIQNDDPIQLARIELLRIKEKQEHAKFSAIPKLIEQANLTNEDLRDFIYYDQNYLLQDYFRGHLILRARISNSGWRLIAQYNSKIATELCKDPAFLPEFRDHQLNDIAKQFKQPCIIILALDKNLFSGEELSQLVKKHGNEILQVILTNPIYAKKLYAFEVLSTALQQTNAISHDAQNSANAAQNETDNGDEYVALGLHYQKQKNYMTAYYCYTAAIKCKNKLAPLKIAQLAEFLTNKKQHLEDAAKLYKNDPDFNSPEHAVVCYELLLETGTYLEYRYLTYQYYLDREDIKQNDPRIAKLIQQLDNYKDSTLCIGLIETAKKYWAAPSAKQNRMLAQKRITDDPFLQYVAEKLNTIQPKTDLHCNCYRELWKFYTAYELEELAWKNCEKYLSIIGDKPELLPANEWMEIALLYDRICLAPEDNVTFSMVLPLLRYYSNVFFRSIKDSKLYIQAQSLTSTLVTELPNCTLTTAANTHLFSKLAVESPLIKKISGAAFDGFVIKNAKVYAEIVILLDKNQKLIPIYGAYLLLMKYHESTDKYNAAYVTKLINTANLTSHDLKTILLAIKVNSAFIMFMYNDLSLRDRLSPEQWQELALKHSILSADIKKPNEDKSHSDVKSAPQLTYRQQVQFWYPNNSAHNLGLADSTPAQGCNSDSKDETEMMQLTLVPK